MKKLTSVFLTTCAIILSGCTINAVKENSRIKEELCVSIFASCEDNKPHIISQKEKLIKPNTPEYLEFQKTEEWANFFDKHTHGFDIYKVHMVLKIPKNYHTDGFSFDLHSEMTKVSENCESHLTRIEKAKIQSDLFEKDVAQRYQMENREVAVMFSEELSDTQIMHNINLSFPKNGKNKINITRNFVTEKKLISGCLVNKKFFIEDNRKLPEINDETVEIEYYIHKPKYVVTSLSKENKQKAVSSMTYLK